MKIVIRSIPAKGLELNETLEPSVIGLSADDIRALSPLLVKGSVSRVGDTVVAHTEVTSHYMMECARCLREVAIDREDEFDFDYRIEEGMESIDLGEDIRQEVLMRMPLRVLCRQDCKGICLGCGVDLNVEQCKCKK